jgi:hypothetical protein
MTRLLRDVGLIFSAILLFAAIVLAAEEITITTYYPSPYGVYNQLQTNSLGVGDNNASGDLDSGDVPNPATNPGDVWIKGNVGIGTASPDPAAKLEVAGQVKITGGSPAAGRILTSDANGLASWQPMLINSGSYPGTSSANRSVAHGLGRIPKLILIAEYVQSRDYSIVRPGYIEYHSSATDSTYTVTAADSTNFYVGNSGDYNLSANNAAYTYYWVAI